MQNPQSSSRLPDCCQSLQCIRAQFRKRILPYSFPKKIRKEGEGWGEGSVDLDDVYRIEDHEANIHIIRPSKISKDSQRQRIYLKASLPSE